MQTSKLIAGIKHYGYKPNIGDLDSRIWIQKVAYLLKVAGYGLDYVFVPYKKGPYSFGLKDDYYINRSDYETLATDYKPGSSEIEVLQKVGRSTDLRSTLRLQGTASAAMLILINQTWDDGLLLQRLSAWKSEVLSKEEMMLSIDDAKRILFKDEFLTKEIKDEFDAWEKLSAETVSSN